MPSWRSCPLGADDVCTFDQLARAADVDVVIDYVWGEATVAAMVEILTNRADRGRMLSWVEIGAIAGASAAIPAAALRSARLQIVGSGIGPFPAGTSWKSFRRLPGPLPTATFEVRARAVPLAEVEQVWSSSIGSSDRIVLVP